MAYFLFHGFKEIDGVGISACGVGISACLYFLGSRSIHQIHDANLIFIKWLSGIL